MSKLVKDTYLGMAVRKLSVVSVTCVSVASCASLGGPPDKQVGARVMARYAALIADDYKAAHTFYTPAFRNAVTYRELLLMQPPVAKVMKANLVSVRCDADDACDVGVEVTYKMLGGIRGVPEGSLSSRYNEERWLKIDGEWCIYQPD